MKTLMMPRRLSCALAASAAIALTTPARAGCGDGACGRVDWTEVTAEQSGRPVEAKLHGAFAWESSPDFWATHPLAGSLVGYLHTTCIEAGGLANQSCITALESELAKVGTQTPLVFSGPFYDYEMNEPVRPGGLFDEGEEGAAFGIYFGGSPINQNVCPTAFALATNIDPGQAGASGGAGGAIDPSTGGSSPSTSGGTGGSMSTDSEGGAENAVAKPDETEQTSSAGCQLISLDQRSAGASIWMFLALMAAIARRRSAQ